MSRGPKFKPDASKANPVQEWYDAIPTGRFSGNAPMCQWVGPDMWLFHPDSNYPFKFVRANGEEIELGEFRGRHISFDTDGGSIPDFIHGLPNLSRWHFGAAYLVHDWIWHLHSREWPTYSFEESNQILVECIKTLLEEGYLHNNFTGDAGTVRYIWWGVNSPIARAKWDAHYAK